MKTLKIYSRIISEKSNLGRFYNKVTQYIVVYDGNEFKNEHSMELNNPRLRVPFNLLLKTQNKTVIKEFASKLSKYSNSDKWLRKTLTEIIGEKTL